MTEEIATQEPNTLEHAQAQRQYWDGMIAKARDMIPSHIRNGYQAMLVVEHGRTLGLDPLTSLQEIGVIHGKTVMSAKLQMALVRQRCPHARITVKQNDDKATVIICRRYPSDDEATISFTIEDAKRAGLTGNNWSKYPADMLWARAVSRMCRRIFPDVTLGAYAPEDMSAVATPEQGAAEPIEIVQVDDEQG